MQRISRMVAPLATRSFGLVLFVLCLVIFFRSPNSNFIFDEQEALLKNPYLRGERGLLGAFTVDFWGRAPQVTIGSYRPLPNVLWKLVAQIGGLRRPAWFVVLNLAIHTSCAYLLFRLVCSLGKSGGAGRFGVLESKGAGRERFELAGRWSAVIFVVHGVLSEAVCSAVGLADILVGLLTLFAVGFLLHAVRQGGWLGAFGWYSAVVTSILLGLWSKETMLGSALAVPFIGLLLVVWTHLPWRRAFVHCALSLASSVIAVVVYVELRKEFYPTPSSNFLLFVSDSPFSGLIEVFFSWFSPPKLPDSPLNNPLIGASDSLRVPTVLGLFAAQLAQLVLPLHVAGDYSFPSQLPHGWEGDSIFACVILTVFACCAGWAAHRIAGPSRPDRERDGYLLFLVGLILMLGSYLPVSNALVLLPTIRAERLLYTPTIGFLILATGGALVLESGLYGSMVARAGAKESLAKRARLRPWCTTMLISYAAVLGVCGRLHANIYQNDLKFWSATYRKSQPSAKAALNLGLMLGSRGDLDARERLTHRAIELAPSWDMAHVYLGDVLCRKNELELARDPYLTGLSRSPNSKALTALALTCIWEKEAYGTYRQELFRIAREHPRSWLSYFLSELDENGKRNHGLPAQYRPNGYNRAPAN